MERSPRLYLQFVYTSDLYRPSDVYPMEKMESCVGFWVRFPVVHVISWTEPPDQVIVGGPAGGFVNTIWQFAWRVRMVRMAATMGSGLNMISLVLGIFLGCLQSCL